MENTNCAYIDRTITYRRTKTGQEDSVCTAHVTIHKFPSPFDLKQRKQQGTHSRGVGGEERQVMFAILLSLCTNISKKISQKYGLFRRY
jgi:hypothetical protein